jgi:hypothetical protein
LLTKGASLPFWGAAVTFEEGLTQWKKGNYIEGLAGMAMGTGQMGLDVTVTYGAARTGARVLRLATARTAASELGQAGRMLAPGSNGQGLIGLVRPGGTVDPSLRAVYTEIARSPEFARALESYNAIARRLGQTQAATVEEVIAALGNDVTFSRIGHLRSGLFTAGQHPGSTPFWLQGNPLTSYGQRVGRHELTHLGAALRGQQDTFLHEITVQLATTPENLAIGGGVIVIVGGTAYVVSR